MSHALDELRGALERAIAAEIDPRLELIARLRGALDAYEAQLRIATEAAFSRRAAAAVGVELAAVDAGVATDEVVRTATDLLDALSTPPSSESEEPLLRESHPVVEAPPAELQPVSAEALRAWAAGPTNDESPPASRDTNRDRELLRGLLQRVGEPPSETTDVALIEELDRLDEASCPENLERWAKLTRDAQRTWIAYLVARGRALRDRAANAPSLRGRIREVLVRFPTFASTTRPGFINGMSPEHGPETDSWEGDAREFLVELRVIAPLRTGRSAESREAAPASRRSGDAPHLASVDDDLDEVESPIDTALRARLAGMRIILFGGSPREDARLNLEQALGCAKLEWPESDKPRRVDAIAAAIARGSYSLVLVTRLVYHAESNKIVAAAKAAGVPFAFVETGYGLSAVRLAVEMALDGGRRHASAS